jgi:hypothetical protein
MQKVKNPSIATAKQSAFFIIPPRNYATPPGRLNQKTDEQNQSRVLVTGAGGFSGSHLVARLVKLGAWVRAPAYYNSRND